MVVVLEPGSPRGPSQALEGRFLLELSGFELELPGRWVGQGWLPGHGREPDQLVLVPFGGAIFDDHLLLGSQPALVVGPGPP